MEYRVIRAQLIILLVNEVDEALTCGWVLQGGVAYADGNYLQAIVRI